MYCRVNPSIFLLRLFGRYLSPYNKITNTGNLKPTSLSVRDKGLKALYPLTDTVFKVNRPPSKSLQLFRSFITPILSYGAEIWNLLTAHQLSGIDHNPEALVEYALKTDTEKFHLKFCKQIMGLKRSCSSLAVLGELGQIPLMITNLASMIKYWRRRETLGNQSILKEAYIEMKSLPDNICLWNSNVKAVLKLLSLDAVYDNAKQYTINALFNIVKRKLKSFFIEKWKTKINRASETSQDNRKLRFYKLFKADFKLEGYLSQIPSRREGTRI